MCRISHFGAISFYYFACNRGFSLERDGNNVNEMAVVETWSFCFGIVGVYDVIPVMCYYYFSC
jgi:hypothetical protein